MFNAGGVDALLALYELGVTMSVEPGKYVEGTEAIREVLNGFLAMKGEVSIETTKL
jgi:hypothetical protein